MVSIEQIKQIREETGVSVIECKKALKETEGDIEKAKEVLRKWGKSLAGKRFGKETAQGIIECYLHPNKKVGVMLEIRCESDFVAKSEDFQNLSHELCLQVAALKPSFVKEEDIPEDLLEKERKICLEQIKNSDKPKKVTDQIVEGKIKKYKEEISLLSQPWIKDDKMKIKDLLEDYTAKIGENIIIKSFIRYEI
ncbi:MAG: elongation factor Ts [Candidatus Nealsonbacteria bacterium]